MSLRLSGLCVPEKCNIMIMLGEASACSLKNFSASGRPRPVSGLHGLGSFPVTQCESLSYKIERAVWVVMRWGVSQT